MNAIASDWLSHPLWAQLGLTLTHFLWQGAVIAVVLAALLWLLRRASPGWRYGACAGAVLAMALSPPATLWYVRSHPLPNVAELAPAPTPAHDASAPVLDRPPTTAVPAAAASDLADASSGIAHAPAAFASDVPVAALPPSAPETAPSVASSPDEIATTAGLDRDRLTHWLMQSVPIAALVWCGGVLFLAVRLIIGWMGLHRLRMRRTRSLDGDLAGLVERVAGRLGLGRSVTVLSTDALAEPVAFGLVRPVVLLPISLLTQCPVELVEAVIAHELAHIRRHDLWLNLLQRVVETLLFYHPAVWWVSGRMRLERELSCDDLAVSSTRKRAEYAEALVVLSRLQGVPAGRSWAMGMFSDRMTIASRVRRVLQLSPTPQQSRFWLAGPLALLLAGSLIAVTRLHAADAPDPPGTDRRASADDATPAGPGTLARADGKRDTGAAALPVPSVEQNPPPETGIIETDFSGLTGEVEAYQKELAAQWAMLTPAQEAIDKFHAFRAAVSDRDDDELLRLFRPFGQPVTKQSIDQLLADVKALGLDDYPEPWSPPWLVESVSWYNYNGKKALLCGNVFPLTASIYDRSGLPVRLWCWLSHHDDAGWIVNRLSVMPQDQTRRPSLLSIRRPAPPARRPGRSAGRGSPPAGSSAPTPLDSLAKPLAEFAEAAARSGRAIPHTIPITTVQFLNGRPHAYFRATITHTEATEAGDSPTFKLDSPPGAHTFLPALQEVVCYPVGPDEDARSTGARYSRYSYAGATPGPGGTGRYRASPGSSPPPQRVETVGHFVRTMADGLITEVKVAKGQEVKKGELLVQLDSADIEIALAEAEVKLTDAQADYERVKAIRARAAASEQELLKFRSALELAKLALQRQKLRLERTRITSPADGVVTDVARECGVGRKLAAGDWVVQITSPAPEHEAEPKAEPTRPGAAARGG